MALACSGNDCGCDMSMGAPVIMGKPHCNRWQQSERSHYKEVLFGPKWRTNNWDSCYMKGWLLPRAAAETC